MPTVFKNRLLHYPLLLTVSCTLCIFNLGKASLWDIDEGNNSEAAREMLEAENWVVPTFNYELRVDKPAMIYWLQIFSYKLLGIHEASARTPSAIAAILTVLVCYELAQLLFGGPTAFVAALILCTSLGFGVAAQFANPDALLLLFSTLCLFFFYRGYKRGDRTWFFTTAASAGLAVLTKGPVGVVLPATVLISFLIWERRLAVLWDRRYFLSWILFVAVALPWYAWVAVDTKASFLKGFFLVHNVNRFLSPMENHWGPIYYYLLIVTVGMMPWSAFLGAAAWAASGKRKESDNHSNSVYRFLWCWIAIYLVFFSFSRTKLPNYILPIYPPVSILLGRFLVRWLQERSLTVRGWMQTACIASLVLIGVGLSVGLHIAGTGWLTRGSIVPLAGLELWAFIGLFPIIGAAVFLWGLYKEKYQLPMIGMGLTAFVLLSCLLHGAALTLDGHKAARYLVEHAGTCKENTQIHLAAYHYFQPSLVFYSRREIRRIERQENLLVFMRRPEPVYVFVPQSVQREQQLPGVVVAEHYDLYKRQTIVVLANRQAVALREHAEMALRHSLE